MSTRAARVRANLVATTTAATWITPEQGCAIRMMSRANAGAEAALTRYRPDWRDLSHAQDATDVQVTCNA